MNLIDTVHRMHNITTWKGRLFVGKMNDWLKQEHILAMNTLIQ